MPSASHCQTSTTAFGIGAQVAEAASTRRRDAAATVPYARPPRTATAVRRFMLPFDGATRRRVYHGPVSVDINSAGVKQGWRSGLLPAIDGLGFRSLVVPKLGRDA